MNCVAGARFLPSPPALTRGTSGASCRASHQGHCQHNVLSAAALPARAALDRTQRTIGFAFCFGFGLLLSFMVGAP